jgi:predicted phage-related endonuclease|tara:strand:+ start:677 stop:1435 length:759 start_codon:yes stop_codon:yes gene_type:complete
MSIDIKSTEVPESNARYVCEASSDQWLAMRKQVAVTASDVAVLMDANPYQKADTLVERKLADFELQQNAPMWWGSWMEGPVADATGVALGLHTLNVQRFYVRDDLSIGATTDGYAWLDRESGFEPDLAAVRGPKTDQKGYDLGDDKLFDKSWATDLLQCIEGHGKPLLLEVKTTAQFVGQKYNYRECPPLYFAQVQAQMLVTGWDAALVTCLVGGRDLKCWMVEADIDYQHDIIERVAGFRAELETLRKELC